MAVDQPDKAKEEHAEAKATPVHHGKKEKAQHDKEPTTGKDGDKKKGIYDASPVIEGKRERKQVERLEVALPVKSPEPTVKQVHQVARRCGAHGRGTGPLELAPHAPTCPNPPDPQYCFKPSGQGRQAGGDSQR